MPYGSKSEPNLKVKKRHGNSMNLTLTFVWWGHKCMLPQNTDITKTCPTKVGIRF